MPFKRAGEPVGSVLRLRTAQSTSGSSAVAITQLTHMCPKWDTVLAVTGGEGWLFGLHCDYLLVVWAIIVCAVVCLAVVKGEPICKRRPDRVSWIRDSGYAGYLLAPFREMNRRIGEYVAISRPSPKEYWDNSYIPSHYRLRSLGFVDREGRQWNDNPSDSGMTLGTDNKRLARLAQESLFAGSTEHIGIPASVLKYSPRWRRSGVLQNCGKNELLLFTGNFSFNERNIVHTFEYDKSSLHGFQRYGGSLGGVLGSEGSIFSSPSLIPHSRQTIATELPLAMDVQQLDASYYPQDDSGNHEGHSRINKPSVKSYLVIFVLLVVCVVFSLLSLRFALNVKDRDTAFVMRKRMFIIFLVIAQCCAILAGLLIAQEIIG